jgi:hypothetical protein
MDITRPLINIRAGANDDDDDDMVVDLACSQ